MASDETSKGDDLRGRALRGVVWTFGSYAVTFGTRIAGLMILSRILSPDIFGQFAICLMAVGIGNTFFAMGLGAALVQRKDDADRFIDVVWSANLVVALMIALCLELGSHWIVLDFFEMPEALWPFRTSVLAVVVVGFSCPSLPMLVKDLETKKLFWLSASKSFVHLVVSVTTAVAWPSIWALVLGNLAADAVYILGSYFARFRLPRFELSWTKFRVLYRFSFWLQLRNIAMWSANNIDSLVVGRLLGATELGHYNRGLRLAQLPEAPMTLVVNKVAFPMLSAMQDDESRSRRAAGYVFDLALLTVCPATVVAMTLGEPIVALVLGPQWIDTTPIFQALSLAVGFRVLVDIFSPLVRSRGESRMELVGLFIRVSVASVVLYPCVSRWGAVGGAAAIGAGALAAWPYQLRAAHRVAGLGVREWLPSLLVGASVSTAVVAGAWALGLVGTWLGGALSVVALGLGLLLLGLLGVGPGRFPVQLVRERSRRRAGG